VRPAAAYQSATDWRDRSRRPFEGTGLHSRIVECRAWNGPPHIRAIHFIGGDQMRDARRSTRSHVPNWGYYGDLLDSDEALCVSRAQSRLERRHGSFPGPPGRLKLDDGSTLLPDGGRGPPARDAVDGSRLVADLRTFSQRVSNGVSYKILYSRAASVDPGASKLETERAARGPIRLTSMCTQPDRRRSMEAQREPVSDYWNFSRGVAAQPILSASPWFTAMTKSSIAP